MNGNVSPELELDALRHELDGCRTEIGRLRRLSDDQRALHAYWKQAARQLMDAFKELPAPDNLTSCEVGSPPGAGDTNDRGV